ncbi:CAAX prenyl protease-related protein [Massilia sp. METH4]|uniref:CAAX prenyl protease-related protein n=1 Tax=Massilia sp. METH4 TaxID=3123041 RepID=UPI0030D340FF
MQPDTPKNSNQPATSAGPVRGHGFFNPDSLPRIVPFGIYMAFIVVADLLARAGWEAADQLWLYPVKILAVCAALWVYRSSYRELAWQGMAARHWIEAIVTGIVVLVLWVNLDAPWMQVGSAAGYAPFGADGRIDWLLVACRIAGAALVVPVMEELFWRSFLMRWLERSTFLTVSPGSVRLFAFCVTAVLFGIEHTLWLAGIVAGIAYGALYIRSGNLWSPILAHAVTNGLLGGWIVLTENWAYW